MQEKSDTKNPPNQVPSEFNHLPDSETYIRKLERRLIKIKGTDKKLTSKGMLSNLQQARDDYMSRLISSSAEQLSLFNFPESDQEVSVSFVERKLFPERNGVTFEELQHLLESDVLAKISSESSSESPDIGAER